MKPKKDFYKKSIEKVISSILFFFLWYTKIECMFEKTVGDGRTGKGLKFQIFADGELEESSVIRKFRITASDGKSYNTNHYNLKAIIAVGNKVDSVRAVQFRKWANGIIEEFTIKGFAMKDWAEQFEEILTVCY